jgi:hypothetical protein
MLSCSFSLSELLTPSFRLRREARDPERRNKGKSDADKAGGIGALLFLAKMRWNIIAYVSLLCVVWFLCSTASMYLAAGLQDQVTTNTCGQLCR